MRNGDADAFATLVSRHARMVFATCRRILRNATEAEDVAQECFLRLAMPENKLAANPVARLHALAVYRSLDRLRNLARRRQREIRYLSGSPDSVEQQWHDVEPHVDAALGELHEDLR